MKLETNLEKKDDTEVKLFVIIWNRNYDRIRLALIQLDSSANTK